MRVFRSNSLIPELVKNLLIINVLMFLGTLLLRGTSYDISRYLILYPFQSVFFRPYQLLSHMFMHGSFSHLFFNMFGLWMFGSALEKVWGPRKFFIFYLLSGLGAALLQSAWMTYEYPMDILVNNPNVGMLGASGAVYGILIAFAMYWPNTELFLIFFPVPIKAKYMILIMVILELTLGFGNLINDGIAHFAHLGGALVGFILVKLWNKTNRNSLY